jgi:hypothetical protein
MCISCEEITQKFKADDDDSMVLPDTPPSSSKSATSLPDTPSSSSRSARSLPNTPSSSGKSSRKRSRQCFELDDDAPVEHELAPVDHDKPVEKDAPVNDDTRLSSLAVSTTNNSGVKKSTRGFVYNQKGAKWEKHDVSAPNIIAHPPLPVRKQTTLDCVRVPPPQSRDAVVAGVKTFMQTQQLEPATKLMPVIPRHILDAALAGVEAASQLETPRKSISPASSASASSADVPIMRNAKTLRGGKFSKNPAYDEVQIVWILKEHKTFMEPVQSEVAPAVFFRDLMEKGLRCGIFVASARVNAESLRHIVRKDIQDNM